MSISQPADPALPATSALPALPPGEVAYVTRDFRLVTAVRARFPVLWREGGAM